MLMFIWSSSCKRSKGLDKIVAHSILFDGLKKLKHTAWITNIACIGLGTLQSSACTKTNPTIQHIVAWSSTNLRLYS